MTDMKHQVKTGLTMIMALLCFGEWLGVSVTYDLVYYIKEFTII